MRGKRLSYCNHGIAEPSFGGYFFAHTTGAVSFFTEGSKLEGE